MPKANAAYRPFKDSPYRYAVLYGGAGSGKSYAAAQKLVWRASTTPGERFLVIRKVHRTIKASTFRLLRDVISDWGIPAQINLSDLSIKFPASGSEILHAGLDDVEKLKSITGITSVWIEEATELTREDFDQTDLRLRGDCPSYRQVILSFNPVRSSHWLRLWIESKKDDPDLYVLRTTHRDNAFVDDQYRRVLASLPEKMRQVYEAGQWGDDNRGLIFTNWAQRPFRVEGRPHVYGLDFGFNHPTAMVAIWLADPEIRVRQVIYESHLTTPDLIARMKDEGVEQDGSVEIFCDSARPDQIEELNRAGFYAVPANKDVLSGIATLQSYQIVIDPDATGIAKELSEYSWAEDKDGRPLDKPVKFMDDGIDALRYGAHSYLLTAPSWGSW